MNNTINLPITINMAGIDNVINIEIPYYYSEINGDFYIAFNEIISSESPGEFTTVTLSDRQVDAVRTHIGNLLRSMDNE